MKFTLSSFFFFFFYKLTQKTRHLPPLAFAMKYEAAVMKRQTDAD
jgi:hypothetical protein